MKMNGNNNKYLIIYHKEDNDGVFSASIMIDYLISTFGDTVTIDTLGGDYNMLSNLYKDNIIDEWKEKYNIVVMTDISFDNIKAMKKLYKEFKNNFIWIDHHAPIIKESIYIGIDNIVGVRSTDRSAILCMYKYLYDQFDEQYREGTINKLYTILSAYDSFTWDNHGLEKDFCVSVNKAVTVKYNLNLDDIVKFIGKLKSYSYEEQDQVISELYDSGKMLYDYDKQNWAQLIERYGDCTWKIEYNDCYRKACALFIQGPSTSLMFDTCAEDIVNGIVFKHLNDSNWVMSLYNINQDDDFHCGEFLKQRYNGGGHKGAAGCTLSEKQFRKILEYCII